MKALPFAEEINYWMTSKKSPDTWFDMSIKQIEEVGGKVTHHAMGMQHGRGCMMMAFTLADDTYSLLFPILESSKGNEGAARRQAATLMYHDIKAKCMLVKVFGARFAFCQYLMLNGSPVGQQIAAGTFEGLPKLLE